MKYTVLGFHQGSAVALGLGLDELMILRWFVDFQGTGKMVRYSMEDGDYLWVDYKSVLRIDGTRIRDRTMSEQEKNSLFAVLEAVERDGKIQFQEGTRVSVRDLRRQIDCFKPDAVFVDHIGLMERPEKVRDPYRALGLVSNGLKQPAMEKNIAVIVLSQMNRDIERRAVKIPMLSDLRESGDIEQDADYVLCPWAEDTAGRILSGDAWADVMLHLLKNRHGRTGRFPFHWQPQYHTFQEVETKYDQA